jgi:hypothetical protein
VQGTVWLDGWEEVLKLAGSSAAPAQSLLEAALLEHPLSGVPAMLFEELMLHI